MNLPLYRSVREHYPGARSTPNASLIFDRFVGWDDGWQAGGHKQKLFEEVIKSSADREMLNAFLERRNRQVEALGGVTLEAETVGRFVSGLGGAHPFETGFVWHRTLGVPYLPGSGIKGAVRAWAEQWSDEVDAARLFGDPGGMGALVVLDALPTRPPRLETDVMTPHYGEYYREGKPSGDYLSPIPVPFLAVAAGQGFRFSLLPREEGDVESLQRGAKLLKDALENIGAGAKTSYGYGAFSVKTPKRAGDDPRFEPLRRRIESYGEQEYGSVSAWVDELEALPEGQKRKQLAEQLHGKVYANKSKRKRMREKAWFVRLQRMREDG